MGREELLGSWDVELVETGAPAAVAAIDGDLLGGVGAGVESEGVVDDRLLDMSVVASVEVVDCPRLPKEQRSLVVGAFESRLRGGRLGVNG